jgi:phosphoglucomutase
MSGAIETSSRETLSPLAGKPVPKEMLVDVARLEREYYERRPDVSDPNQMVSFGTNGHRGSPLRGTFTEAHILAITQAICDYRRAHGTDGPTYLGKDTHALSDPAQRSALGYKYNPANGGPADTDVTEWVENRANELLRGKNAGVKRDAPATPEQKKQLRNLSPDAVRESSLAGEPIIAKLTRATGNGAPIGGLYAESFKDESHLNAILREAEEIVNRALSS